MKRVLTIRERLLLAALLPLAVIITLLAAVLLRLSFNDLQVSFDQRNRSVARQIAMASEFGLFSANQVQLQVLANGALHEADARWVAILDYRGRILSSAGKQSRAILPPLSAVETRQFDSENQLDWLTQPVLTSEIPMDDLFEKNRGFDSSARRQLGQVVLVFSRESVAAHQRTMLVSGAVIGFFSLLFGLLLAAYLSRGVLRPITGITQLIAHISRGDFAEVEKLRGLYLAQNPLHALQSDICRMADQLRSSHDDLAQQVTVATQSLREKVKEAEQANLAKSRFLAAASHDLRQPTHALGLFVSRLAQLPHDTQTGELIAHLEASVQAMQDLLDGLLDVSRLEAGAVQVNRNAFALTRLFDQLEHDLAPVFREKGINLRVRPSALWVMSDITLIHRILLNIVGNALRYTERGGVLVVARHMLSANLVRVQVWDSGVGIAPEHHRAVFAEFFQVANSARDRTKGFGLGLNIVQRTAELLGHKLALRSTLGQGTCFSLDLPLVLPQRSASVDYLHAPDTMDDWQDQRVMVVEDDVLARAALVSLLESWGLHVLPARDLAAACQHLAEGKVPACIVSDYRLQDDINGVELVQHLRGLMGVLTPACIISGDTDPSLIQSVQAMGLTLLHKPVRPAKLRTLLRRLLTQSVLPK